MGIGLETLFHLVYEFVHWLLDWTTLEHFHLECTDGGVLISGEKCRVLKPGHYWYHTERWALYHTNVQPRPHALDDQLLTTQDGKRVRAGGVLVYRITDVVKWLVENENAAESVAEMAAHALREVIITSDFAEMQQAREQKRDVLTRSAQEMLSMFGVRVEYLRLTSFAETDAKDLHHSGSLVSAAEASDEDED